MMFTGLIEEMGRIARVERGRPSRLFVAAEETISDLSIGSSIAVNGACLTVTDLTPSSFAADLSPETLKATNLGALVVGDPVNLERPLRLGDRLGGHLVTGHVDGVGRIREKRVTGDLAWMTFSCPAPFRDWLVPKGSVAVDGISLTVVEVGEESFTVQLIPLTYRRTTLAGKGIGDRVNLEADLMAKYIQRLLSFYREPGRAAGIDEAFLAQHGFVGQKDER